LVLPAFRGSIAMMKIARLLPLIVVVFDLRVKIIIRRR